MASASCGDSGLLIRPASPSPWATSAPPAHSYSLITVLSTILGVWSCVGLGRAVSTPRVVCVGCAWIPSRNVT